MTDIYKFQMSLKAAEIPYVIGHESGETQIIYADPDMSIAIAHFDADGARK